MQKEQFSFQLSGEVQGKKLSLSFLISVEQSCLWLTSGKGVDTGQ